ncbi:MAG: DEAD/DEAH box helicase [Saprospiraceae bacterium]
MRYSSSLRRYQFVRKTKNQEKPPNILITTPESLHLLLATPNADYFKNLHSVVVDEWHELIGSKRGVLMELALSRLKSLQKGLRIWGISATIGNMEESMEVL